MADYKDGISRSISSTPPSHYIVKIQSFSLLAKKDIKTFPSGIFEAGGYKWKLILHLNGNKDKNVDDHISLYLKMVVNEGSLCLGSEVHATFRFFLFDQHNNDYLVIQDTVRCFHLLKHEWGIDRLISLEAFENPSNGYLVNDTCAFGAEVYVCQKQVTGKVDCLSMVNYPITYTHTWNIPNVFKLDVKGDQESTTFIAGDQKWKIKICPKGDGKGASTHLSLFLYLADTTSLPTGSQICAEFTFTVVDQNSSVNSFAKPSGKLWFSASTPAFGWPEFMSFTDINSPNKGYIKNKSCILEAKVTVHGIMKAL